MKLEKPQYWPVLGFFNSKTSEQEFLVREHLNFKSTNIILFTEKAPKS